MPILHVSRDEMEEAITQNWGLCYVCDLFTRGCTHPDAKDLICPKCGEQSVIGARRAKVEGFVKVLNESDVVKQ